MEKGRLAEGLATKWLLILKSKISDWQWNNATEILVQCSLGQKKKKKRPLGITWKKKKEN